ncbi:MAG: hypothetical protein IJP09_03305 [Clostridia bacterium]|nr:hypothetical protein [Clostridia bacterium]
MESTAENKKLLTVRPPKLKNLIYTVVFAIICGLSVALLCFAAGEEPTTISEKVLNCARFILATAGTVFSFGGALDSFRNIFAKPTFSVSEDEIFICKYGKTALSNLESTELKKKGNILVFKFKDGSSAVLRSRISEVPLETVVYAISLRQK